MDEGLQEVCGGLFVLLMMPIVAWVVASVASAQNERESGDKWLDAPGDDQGSGWTNFDYIVASELEDMWSNDE